MRNDELLDAIGEAKDEYIRDARRGKRIPRWVKWTSAVAACLVVALGGSFFLGRPGANAGSGGDKDLVYMSYAGPVLPLTVQGDATGITAGRNINYDFSPYITRQESYGEGENIRYYDIYDSKSVITDNYVLKNETQQDLAVTLLYPFVGDMLQFAYYPRISLNGSKVSAVMHPGPYTGGFQGVSGTDEQETGSVNLKPLDSFGGYQALLGTDAYLKSAFDAFPALAQKVYVYWLHDFQYSENTEASNPTLRMDFYVDYEKTVVFSYGINGLAWDPESGYCSRRKGGIQHRPDLNPEFQHPDDGYVILLGEDLESYTLRGYRDGGCKEGDELEDLGCTVTRYETTLGQILSELLEDFMGKSHPDLELFAMGEIYSGDMSVRELYLGLTAELLCDYGVIGESPVERYEDGMLEGIFSGVDSDGRVIYLSFDAVIPAGGSITVEAALEKKASTDFHGKDKGKDGYDLATHLGSKLAFTEQTASVSGYAEIEIVSQNFGFDIDTGITKVTLDPAEAHYWMEIRKLPKRVFE